MITTIYCYMRIYIVHHLPSIFHLLVGIKFEKHQCKKLCMDDQKYTYDPEKFVSKEEKLKNFNPILIPVILGWKRQCTKHKNMGKRSIYYVSPCGRRLRNLVRLKMTFFRGEIRYFVLCLCHVYCRVPFYFGFKLGT